MHGRSFLRAGAATALASFPLAGVAANLIDTNDGVTFANGPSLLVASHRSIR